MSNNTIESFDGEYRFLSNFYSVEVHYDGVIYPTVEHAYQAAKTLDVNERLEILNAPTPGKAKRLGKKVTIRENWDKMKVRVMEELIFQKFKPGSELSGMLIATYPKYIIEGNDWGDTFWGVCDGDGKNMLGNILFWIRMTLVLDSRE